MGGKKEILFFLFYMLVSVHITELVDFYNYFVLSGIPFDILGSFVPDFVLIRYG